MAEDNFADHRKITVEQLDRLLRRPAFGESGKIADIGEQRCHQLSYSSEPDCIGRAKYVIDDLAWEEPLETRARLRLFLQPFVAHDRIDRNPGVDRDSAQQVEVISRKSVLHIELIGVDYSDHPARSDDRSSHHRLNGIGEYAFRPETRARPPGVIEKDGNSFGRDF